MERQLAGTIEADDLSHTAGNKGQATQGGKKALGRRACGRRKQREPGRGHYDQDRPAIIAWVSRQGAVVIQAPRDFTVQTVQQAANLAVHAGSRLSTDSASRYRAVQGDVHECVNHTQKAFARRRTRASHGVPVLLAQAILARVPWRRQMEPAGICRRLSVPAELSSAECLRT